MGKIKEGQLMFHLLEKSLWEVSSIQTTPKGTLYRLFNTRTKEYKSYYPDKLEARCLPVTNKKMIKLLYG